MAKTLPGKPRTPHLPGDDFPRIPEAEEDHPAFVAGFRAFKVGVAMLENPFDPGDPEHADIARGWRHGNAWRVADSY